MPRKQHDWLKAVCIEWHSRHRLGGKNMKFLMRLCNCGHPRPSPALSLSYFARAGKVVYVCAAPAGIRIPTAPIGTPAGASN